MTINNDLQVALDTIPAAAPGYVKAHSYADGTVNEKFANSKLARLLVGSANKFRMNYARVPLNALTDRVRISSFGVTGDNEASDYLDEQWRRNGMENLYKEVHFETASTGSGYLIAWPDPDDETGMNVDVTIVSQETTRVFYDQENTRKIKFAARMWNEGKKVRVNLYYADRIEKYISISEGKAATKKATQFQPYFDLFEEVLDDNNLPVQAPVWPLENPFGRVPIFHFHLGGGYGRPCNRDAWEPQDGINKLTSTMMSAVDYAGAPQRYILQHPATPGMPEGLGGDDVSWDDDEDSSGSKAAIDDGRLKSGPGTAWLLNAKGAGQFEAASMTSFLDPMDRYIKAISTLTKTPLHAFHGMGDTPSGESLRAANAPLNDSAKSFHGWTEPTWLEFMDFLLEIGGYETEEASMYWANPESTEDKDFWDTQTTKIAAGVPKYVAFSEAGYDDETLKSWGLLPPTEEMQAKIDAVETNTVVPPVVEE